MKKDKRGINIASKRTGDGCVECLASPKGWRLHLRRCAECGHIGCRDSSPSQHASKHAAATGLPIIASFEPGEDWFFDYEKQRMITGVKLLPPYSHPGLHSVARWKSSRFHAPERSSGLAKSISARSLIRGYRFLPPLVSLTSRTLFTCLTASNCVCFQRFRRWSTVLFPGE